MDPRPIRSVPFEDQALVPRPSDVAQSVLPHARVPMRPRIRERDAARRPDPQPWNRITRAHRLLHRADREARRRRQRGGGARLRENRQFRLRSGSTSGSGRFGKSPTGGNAAFRDGVAASGRSVIRERTEWHRMPSADGRSSYPRSPLVAAQSRLSRGSVAEDVTRHHVGGGLGDCGDVGGGFV